jgi:hypothetical protein
VSSSPALSLWDVFGYRLTHSEFSVHLGQPGKSAV